jgi:hypothetical protein
LINLAKPESEEKLDEEEEEERDERKLDIPKDSPVGRVGMGAATAVINEGAGI